MHPVELFGEGWQDWGGAAVAARCGAEVSPAAAALTLSEHKG